ncbi:MAG: bifunctional chorismate mutase/prephenate dehydratase [Acutalibacter sp.]
MDRKERTPVEPSEYQARLGKLREEIDEIDGQLLPLFLRRMDCSQRVAQLKGEAGMPVFSPQREQAILDKVREQGGEDGDAAAALYRSIMAISRAKQHKILQNGGALRELERTAARTLHTEGARVVCQGVVGAFSHKAARSFFGEISPSFEPTFQQVFEDVATGSADFGVLPVENSAAGSVTAVYDLILRYRFYIVGAVDVKVEHCLAAGKGTGTPTAAASHPQALSQCSGYLKSHGLKALEWSNTAAAAQYVAQKCPPGVAAICSKEAAREYGLQILQENIQNEAENTTRFIVISKDAILPGDAGKISLCFSLPHETGSLSSVLERFAMEGLNLTKIESRPLPGKNFEYDFYLDFTGNIHHPKTLDLICALQDELPRFSFLGNYSER